MNRAMVERAAEIFLAWDIEIGDNTRLERHEAMKAILFSLSTSARLEHEFRIGSRKRRVDFIDDDILIEVDDGPNRKSVSKLARLDHKDKLWILILAKGKGGRARQQARRHGIDIFRIFTKPTSRWEWILSCGDVITREMQLASQGKGGNDDQKKGDH